MFVSVFPCRKLSKKNGFPIFSRYEMAALCRQVGLHTQQGGRGIQVNPGCQLSQRFIPPWRIWVFLNVASDVGEIYQNIEGNVHC